MPIKIPLSFIVDVNKLKFTEKGKNIQNSQHNIEEEKQNWRTNTTGLPDFL